VEPSFCAAVAQECTARSIPFVLDAVSGLEGALAAGVTVLKINASELRKITGVKDVLAAGMSMLSQYPRLGAVAITDGPRPGFLFTREGTWEYAVPHLEHVVNPIGGGDCATSILARRIAEGATGAGLAEAFAEALSCSCASCLTNIPSVFDWNTAQQIRMRLTFRKLPL
jgi:sugar/nucleoside kinase (ribokinase family)